VQEPRHAAGQDGVVLLVPATQHLDQPVGGCALEPSVAHT